MAQSFGFINLKLLQIDIQTIGNTIYRVGTIFVLKQGYLRQYCLKLNSLLSVELSDLNIHGDENTDIHDLRLHVKDAVRERTPAAWVRSSVADQLIWA